MLSSSALGGKKKGGKLAVGPIHDISFHGEKATAVTWRAFRITRRIAKQAAR